jgi:FAD:protein FMN transferase
MRFDETHDQENLGLHRFSHDAMGTIFEIVIADSDRMGASHAAREAFAETDRLEYELSRFLPASDICHLNNAAPGERVRIGCDALQCLRLAFEVHELTQSAFDIALGTLTDFWRSLARSRPAGDWKNCELSVDEAGRWTSLLEHCGLHHIKIDLSALEAWTDTRGLCCDLGAIGKGHAVDVMLETLRAWGIPAASVHAGQSSVACYGIPDQFNSIEGWTAALRDPNHSEQILGTVSMRDRTLSGSGMRNHGPHIIDPRTGRPAARFQAAWAIAPSAALTDALSTAFMVMTEPEIEQLCAARPEIGALCLKFDKSGRDGIKVPAFFQKNFPQNITGL